MGKVGRKVHRRSPGVVGMLGVALVGVALLAACTGTAPNGQGAPELPADGPSGEAPSEGRTDSEPSEPEPEPVEDETNGDDTGDEHVPLFYVRDVGTFFALEAELRTVPDLDATASEEEQLLTVLRELAQPPVSDELFSFVPDGARVMMVTIDGDTVVVDFDEPAARNPNAGSEGEALFAQQLAHTVRGVTGHTQIRVSIEGIPVDELWGHVDWSQPIEVDDKVLYLG